MRKFAHLSVGFAAALFVMHTWRESHTAAVAACFLAVAVFGVLALRKRWAGMLFLLIGIVLGISWNSFYVEWDARVPDGIDKGSHTIVAQATDYSRKGGNGKWIIFPAEIEIIDEKILEKKIRATVYFAEEHNHLKPGDKLSVKASVSVPEDDEDFNSYTYYKARKIDVMMFAEEGAIITRCDRVPFKYFYTTLRREINDRIARLLPARSSAFLDALIIGDKQELSEELEEELRITGLSHTIAISGMHVSFLVGLIVLLFGKRRAPFFAIPVMFIFVLIAGSTPSVMRAFIMQCFVLIAPLLMREADSITSLLAALFIILFINPYAIKDAGLQLSFSSTLGLILFYDKINSCVYAKFPLKGWKWYNKTLNFVAGTVSATLSATVLTLPITVYYYGTISLIAPIANIIIIWAISMLFSSGVAIVLLSFVWFDAASFLSFIPAWIISGIEFCVNALAQISFASVYAKNGFSVVGLVLFYSGLILWYVLNKSNMNIGKYVALGSFIACVVIIFIGTHLPSSKNAEFTVLDVGQGLSVMAEFKNHRVVIDCGGDSWYSGNTVYNEIVKRNTRKIDAIVLTHAHSDHTNGVEVLLNKARVSKLYIPASVGGAESLMNIIKTAHLRGTKVIAVEEDETLSFDALKLRLICCYGDKNENDTGMAVIATKGNFDVVITGDFGEEIETYLVNRKRIPNSEVYVAGHHGADSSSSEYFLNEIKPEYAVISAGKNNIYGHPSEETLAIFKKQGITVRRTDEEGTIHFASGGVFEEE